LPCGPYPKETFVEAGRGKRYLGNQRPFRGQAESHEELSMSKVFVLENGKRPLVPIHPGGARRLLAAGKAAVYRRYPFTIILHATVEKPAPPPLRLKIDPGANTTGLAVVNDSSGEVVWAAELAHRGRAVKDALDKRRSVRRRRRARHTRYRQPRFCNRRRPTGWLDLPASPRRNACFLPMAQARGIRRRNWVK